MKVCQDISAHTADPAHGLKYFCWICVLYCSFFFPFFFDQDLAILQIEPFLQVVFEIVFDTLIMKFAKYPRLHQSSKLWCQTLYFILDKPKKELNV